MSITSYAPGSARRVQPRSRMASSAAEVDLSGTWRFRYSARPDLAPAGADSSVYSSACPVPRNRSQFSTS